MLLPPGYETRTPQFVAPSRDQDGDEDGDEEISSRPDRVAHSGAGPETDHSITMQDRHRRREETRTYAALFMVGDANAIAPRPATRVIPFETTLRVGRRHPAEPGVQSLAVKDPLVSGQHFQITREHDGVHLRDLGSRNGTVVDGVLVKDAVKLRDGAIIFFGIQVVLFRAVTPSELDAIQTELASPLGPVATVSPALASVCRNLRKLAVGDTEILLTGETGVGKEIYARAVHETSGRAGKFVAINCAAVPRELVESELYGYVRGAHSQATGTKRGLIEEAEGGTLFLDEIGEMPMELQSKLLRFLQDREITPLGGTKGRRVDVRIVAATNRTVASTTSSSNLGLRTDLAARLGAEPIRIPPLRHRIEDIGALAAHFLKGKDATFEPLAYQALAVHSWPANVRELEKVVTTAELLARDADEIKVDHLPAAIAGTPSRLKSSPAGALARPPKPTAGELQQLLERCHGNVQKVARELSRTPPLIYKWCRQYKLDPDRFRPSD